MDTIIPTPYNQDLLDLVKAQDPDVLTAWHKCTRAQQDFIIYVLQDLPNYEAYRLAHKLPLSNKRSLEAMACMSLRSVNIKPVMAALNNRRDLDLHKVINTLTEAVEAVKDSLEVDSDGVTRAIKAPDWPIRLKAADQLAKLHALNAPVKQIVDVRSTVIRYHKPERDPIDIIAHEEPGTQWLDADPDTLQDLP
jgi:hypothetical protein